MKKFLAVALVVVATPATAATAWEANSRRCQIDKWFSRDVDAYEFTAEGKLLVTIGPKDLPAIKRGVAILEACAPFWRCVRERDAGKKRRCRIPK